MPHEEGVPRRVGVPGLSAPLQMRGGSPVATFFPEVAPPRRPPTPLPHSPPSSHPFLRLSHSRSLPAQSQPRRDPGALGAPLRGPSVCPLEGAAVGLSVCPSSAVLLSLSVLGGCPSVCPGVWLCVRTPLAVGVPVHFPGVHLLGCLSVPYPQRPPSVPRGVCPSSRCLSTHWGVHLGVQVCIEVSPCPSGRPSPLPPPPRLLTPDPTCCLSFRPWWAAPLVVGAVEVPEATLVFSSQGMCTLGCTGWDGGAV